MPTKSGQKKKSGLPEVNSIKNCPACGQVFYNLDSSNVRSLSDHLIRTIPYIQAYPTHILRTCPNCREQWKERRKDKKE